MKKLLVTIAILLAVFLTTPLVGVAFAEESAPDDYVISRKRTQSDEGLTVTLPENSEVTLTADEPLVSKGFLAVTLTVKSVEHAAGDTYAPIIFSVNGAVVAGENMADEEHELVQNALDKSGKYPFAVEQKWGNYFFFPSGFLESTLYLPCASGTAVTSLTLTTDATHRSVLKIEKITTASEVLGTGEGEFSLAYDSDENGVLSDSRVTLKNGASAIMWYKLEWHEVSAVKIDEGFVGGVRIKVKDLANGGVKQDELDEQGGYGYISFDVPDYTPTGGLAMNVIGFSGECYFRVRLVDENDVNWDVVVEGESFDEPEYFPFCVDDLPAAIYAFYEAIFIVRSEQGTVYLDYSRFAPSKAGATMGRIKTVAIGFDHYWGLGRSMGVSAIADVDVVAKEVHRLLNLTELTDADLSLTPDTVVYCNEPSAYRDNFELYRIAERDLKFDTGKTITMPEKGYLSVVPSIHDTKGCGAAMGAGSAIFGLCACALAIGLGKVKGGKR